MKKEQIYNLFLVTVGIVFTIVFWYFSLFSNYLNGDSIIDKYFLHTVTFIASHGLLYYSVKMFRNSLKTKLHFYCQNIYIGRNNMKCTSQCERCSNIEKSK